MTTREHSCVHHGHVWLESDGRLYMRNRTRAPDTTVAVHCQYCDATATLNAHGRSTSPPIVPTGQASMR